MRTQQEIRDRAKARATDDFFGFEISEYLRALDVDSLNALRGTVLKDDADVSGITPDLINDEAIRKHAIDYMAFAWGKANGFRGISASRSMSHYKAWLWMLGQDQFEDIVDGMEFYGKPQLIRICEFLGVDHAQWDDGVRLNEEEGVSEGITNFGSYLA